MGRPPPWTIVATEPLQDCTVFEVQRVLTRSPRTGEAHPFYRIETGDWVNVVPVTPEGQVVMVRQWRHGAAQETLEIPGGMVDPGESPEATAARELLEETGYQAASLHPIGVVNPNPALFGNRCHTFLARGVRPVAAVSNEGHEETHVELLSFEAIEAQLRSGGIDHALVVAAFHWYAMSKAGPP